MAHVGEDEFSADPIYLSTLASLGRSSAVSSKLPPRPGSIVVLPFSNLSDDNEQGYFAESLSEDVLTELARFRDLFVIARNSAFAFKSGTSPIDAAHQLNVVYVLSGRVRKTEKRIRVAAVLTHAPTAREVWSERYERDFIDIFKLQDDLVRTIVVTIEPRLGPAFGRQPSAIKENEFAAYEHVQIARRYSDIHDLDRALPHIKKALELDPNYAHAYVILSSLHYVRFLKTSDRATLDEIESSARRAISLDESDSRGHACLGMALILKGKHELAWHSLDRAISINAADSRAQAYLVEWLIRDGQSDRALIVADEMLQRNPIPPIWYWEVRGLALMMLRRFRDAILAFSRQTEGFWYLHGYLAICHIHLGDKASAKSEMERLLAISPKMTAQDFVSQDHYQKPEDIAFISESLQLAGMPGQ